MKQHIVVAISDNTNSFGLRQIILLAKDGTGFKACSNVLNLPEENEIIPNLYSRGWELIEVIESNPPKEIVDKIWVGR